MKHIEQLFDKVSNALFRVGNTLSYAEVTDLLIELANAIHSFPDDSEGLWSIGECGDCTLDALLVGAYWHYTEWHGGQYSSGYAALCAIGEVFSPGMSSLDSDSSEYFAYQQLNQLAEAK
jgi:hypothetical protein